MHQFEKKDVQMFHSTSHGLCRTIVAPNRIVHPGPLINYLTFPEDLPFHVFERSEELLIEW